MITGGGTGGHIFPMRALADALVARGVSESELRFVGSRRGKESELLGGSAVSLTRLPGRGLQRSWRPGAVVANCGAVGGLLVATVGAVILLRRWRATAVVSVGGYASAAATLAALWWRVPLIVVEFDAAPGVVSRFAARHARWRCCAFPTSGDNVLVTGAPVRSEVESVDRSPPARARTSAHMTPPLDPDRTVVVVMTGSLGSARVNGAVTELAETWRLRTDVALIHVTGRRDFEVVRDRAPKTCGLDYRVVPFADMTLMWTVCDVAICRAGAITVAELTTLAIPSVLVPLPGAPDDHQMKNALTVEGVGGAVVIRDDLCTGEALERVLESITSPSVLSAMAEGARSLGRRGAALRIADVTISARVVP